MPEQKITILISADPSGAISGLKMVGTETEKLAASTKSFTEKMKANWIEFAAGITAAYFAIQKVWGLAEGAANFQESMTVLNALTKQYGTSAEGMVNSIVDASHGFISMKDAATVAGEALVKGFTPQQLVQLAQLSVVMERLSGGSTSAGEAFRSLAETMATGRERGAVKLLGTTIDLNAAYGAQAANMDKAQKMQAIINLAVEQGARLQKTLGDQVESTSDKMKKFTAQVENLKLMLGDFLLRFSAMMMATAQSVAAAVAFFAALILAPISALAAATDYLGITKDRAKDIQNIIKASLAAADDLAHKSTSNIELAKKSMIAPGTGAGPPLPPPGGNENLKNQEKINEILRKLAQERDLIDSAEKDKELVRLNFWFDEQVKKLHDLGANDAAYSVLVQVYAQKRHDDIAAWATKTTDFYIAEQKRLMDESLKIQKDQIDAMLRQETLGAETRLKVEAMGMESAGASPLELIQQQAAGQREILELRAKGLVDTITEQTSFEETLKIMWQVRDVWDQIAASKKIEAADTAKEALTRDYVAQIQVFNDKLGDQKLLLDEVSAKVKAYENLWNYAHTTMMGYTAQLYEVGLSAFKGMEDALTNFVMTGKLKFKEFANSVIADLIRIAIRASITAPLAGGLLSFLNPASAASPGTTSIAGSGFTGTIGGATTFPAMASGGPVFRGSPYLVGEQGPELFVPSSSGAIVPHAGSGNVSVNIRNDSGQPVAATTAKASFDSQGWVVDVVLDAVNRNVHGLRTALGGA